MENLKLKNKFKDLRWRIDFLKEAYPSVVALALQKASVDIDLYPEKGDELTLDAVFSGSKETIVAFLDELAVELPYGAGPVVNSVVRELNWLSKQATEETKADFKLLSQALLSRRGSDTRPS